ncbi:hypothetical protein H6P81_009324 [Aristolochia fimbriata]|uniref:Uncharacterized protein n=1 Tax=Aristolochia fimbriata TaxID=158543 RepID=A0AAV7EL36_ARIFI|nr:hypothetical protein H6P81_009324 [Aristolochia fimbriata]
MEWAMFELARNPKCKETLYQSKIKEACGARPMKTTCLGCLALMPSSMSYKESTPSQ